MTGAKFIVISVSSPGSALPHFYASFSWARSGGGFDGFSLASPATGDLPLTTYTIPVTNAGVGKIRLNVTNSDSRVVYLHSIVLKY